MNTFLIALQFITTLPVKGKLNYSEKNIARSMLYYPLVGTIIGIILVVVNLILSKILPNLVVNILLIISWVALTGGIHLDGLSDSFDGIFGGKDKERILDIMHDSNVGVYGVLAIVLILLLKFTLLTELPIQDKNMLLITVPTISRFAMVLAVYLFPYARKEGFGKAYKLYLKRKHLLVASLWTFLLATVLLFWQGLVLIIVALLSVLLIGKHITNKIEGLTGDNYGAVNEIIEVVILLVSIIVI
ncbi:MAG: adenosylcobinamide-GDP ribazoletransferase [Halanaerobiales bacterium]|nr:adenosylcobinamide-GDP ribazoletransferase [Halanaerobiales bacterium]